MKNTRKYLKKSISVVSFATLTVFSYGFVKSLSSYKVNAGNPNNHQACDAGVVGIEGTDDEVSYSTGDSEIVTGLCVKAGSDNQEGGGHTDIITTDGTTADGCYQISGLGTENVTVTRLVDSNECKGISHVDFITAQAETDDQDDEDTNNEDDSSDNTDEEETSEDNNSEDESENDNQEESEEDDSTDNEEQDESEESNEDEDDQAIGGPIDEDNSDNSSDDSSSDDNNDSSDNNSNDTSSNDNSSESNTEQRSQTLGTSTELESYAATGPTFDLVTNLIGMIGSSITGFASLIRRK